MRQQGQCYLDLPKSARFIVASGAVTRPKPPACLPPARQRKTHSSAWPLYQSLSVWWQDHTACIAAAEGNHSPQVEESARGADRSRALARRPVLLPDECLPGSNSSVARSEMRECENAGCGAVR